MKNIITVLLFLNSILFFGQKNKEHFISYADSTSGQELIGYKTLQGKIAIKAKYLNGSEFLDKMAIVLTDDFQYIGIDRSEKTILIPYIYDNGPDYVEEGLFRFVENKKTGFANLDGQKIIKAQYDFATPFSGGISEYYIGGEKIYMNGKTESQIIKEAGGSGLGDLHWTWGGNIRESGYINKSGQVFENVTELKNNRREAWTKEKKHYLLNKKGQIVKTYRN